jgi:hypothetical protein
VEFIGFVPYYGSPHSRPTIPLRAKRTGKAASGDKVIDISEWTVTLHQWRIR